MGVLRRRGVLKRIACQQKAGATCSWMCSVCGGGADEAIEDDDLAICDQCGKGFHRRCHDPSLHSFGRLDDEQWFCRQCTSLLASSRGLQFQVNEFVWARTMPSSLWWPARVIHIDFISVQDPKPYRVSFVLPDRFGGEAWLSSCSVKRWSEVDPKGIRHRRIHAAMEFAHSAGALCNVPVDRKQALSPLTPQKSRTSSAALVHSQDSPLDSLSKVRCMDVGAVSPAKKQKLEPGRALSAFRVRPCPSIVRAAATRN